jgi:fused signal recognition particle receptor
VILAAADTYRAAASDQLEVWAKRANKQGNVEVVRAKQDAADPASVAFDGAKRARDTKADYLLIDTAGRLHNNKNLMDELAKIHRSVEKNLEVQDVYLVIDGTSGQNALKQAIDFSKVIKITGLVVTKLDGSTKGGILFAVAHKINVPVVYIGTGEGLEDIEEFDPRAFIEGLVGTKI